MNKAVISALRQVLEQAERGEVTAVAIATTSPDLDTGSAYKLGDATLSELLGSIELLKWRMLTNSDREVE
jgi:hypothetical protein